MGKVVSLAEWKAKKGGAVTEPNPTDKRARVEQSLHKITLVMQEIRRLKKLEEEVVGDSD